MATNASACPAAMKATSNGLFQGDNPLHFSLPLAIVQICLVVALTRILAFLLRPLRQPRVIAEIVVSPSSFLILYIGAFLYFHIITTCSFCSVYYSFFKMTSFITLND